MTQPRLANLSLWGDSNAYAEGRAYRDPRDGKQYPSITTILKLHHKDFSQYAADQMLKWAIENWQFLGGRSDERAFTGARYRWRDHAEYRGEIGDGVHNFIEAEHTGSWDVPDLNEEQQQIIEQWYDLNKHHEIVPLRNEITVGHRKVGYMGTFDSYCLLDGVPTLVDFKTSKGVYDTAFMQLAALYYGRTWFIETSDMVWEAIEPEPMEQAVVFHLRADTWKIVPVEDLDLRFEQFQHYAAVWHATQEIKKRERERSTAA